MEGLSKVIKHALFFNFKNSFRSLYAEVNFKIHDATGCPYSQVSQELKATRQ